MLKGIHLSLMIGPAVPVPVSQAVVDALTEVEVRVAAGERSGFKLVFNLSNQSPLQTAFLLAAGNLPPIMRVILVATVNGTADVLIDGVISRYSIAPGSAAGHSQLTLLGHDLTLLMDLIDFSGTPYPAMPAEARVALCIAKYAVLGIVPMVVPSVLIDVPIPTQQIPRHQGTDLKYIQNLAEEVGYVFYLEPGPVPGMNKGYWGPAIKVGPPQPALTLNMDMHTNCDGITFNFDSQSKSLPVVLIQNQASKLPIPVPIPDITPLNPPLGLIKPLPSRLEPVNDTAKYSPVRAAAIGLTKAAKSADTVSGTGSLDVLRYGRLLKARQLVGVRGAGLAFDGLYYVKSVTHSIKLGSYAQSFELTRNGLISTLPTVPV